MKKIFSLIAMLVLITNLLIAQDDFEKGYYINTTGKKTDCLIKSTEKNYNPSNFQFKLSQNEEAQIAQIDTVKEFGILNGFKYIKFTGNIDISGLQITPSDVREPEWRVKTIFLKVLVEGKANLYRYMEDNIGRFFYKLDTTESITQLIFKQYTYSSNSMGTNKDYQRQIWENLPYDINAQEEIERLAYNTDDLINYFLKYNSKFTDRITTKFVKSNTNSFLFSIGMGYISTSLKLVQNKYNGISPVSNSASGFAFSIEGEYQLTKKWSLLVQLLYASSKGKINGDIYFSNADMNTKEQKFGFGIKYYIPIDISKSIYLSAGGMLSKFSSSSSVNVVNPNQYPAFSMKPLNSLQTPGIFANVGFKIKKLQLETSFLSIDEPLTCYDLLLKKNLSVLFTIKYCLFQTK